MEGHDKGGEAQDRDITREGRGKAWHMFCNARASTHVVLKNR